MTYPDINEIQITVSDNSIEQRIESELLKSLRTELTQSTNSNLVLAAKDSKGNLIGGLAGSISYGWLLVKLLWVSDKFQELGIGRSLMDKAESEAFNYDCHSVWLDTSNPKAMKFYSSLGYETFGQLSNKESQHPNDHSRWFMKKQLKGGRAELNLSQSKNRKIGSDPFNSFNSGAPMLLALYANMKMHLYLIVNMIVLLILTGITASALFYFLDLNLIIKIIITIILFFIWGFLIERGITKYTNQFVSKYLLNEND